MEEDGWEFCDSTLLWDALIKLNSHFLTGFTHHEEFQYLVEIFGHTQTHESLKALVYVLYGAGFIVEWQQKMRNGEPLLIAQPPLSERELSRKIDVVTARRLFKICQSNNTTFDPDLLRPFLSNSYTRDQFTNLLASLAPDLKLSV